MSLYKDSSDFERENRFFQSPELEEDKEHLVIAAILEPRAGSLLCLIIRVVGAGRSLADVVQLSHVTISNRHQHSGLHRLPGVLGPGCKLYSLSRTQQSFFF